jgi:glycosyltransferase involved in cell wall biosynthesis
MPVYNGEPYIREALDALLAQTFTDFELIISDNASTDNTEAICREYVRRDSRVKYLRNDVNKGAAWNFNRLVDEASAPFFKWAAADDLHDTEFVARCIAALERVPDAVAAYTKAVIIDEKGRPGEAYDPGWDLQQSDPVERMRVAILMGGHWVNADPLAGVIRTEALRKTKLMPRYQGGDKRPIGELCLIGKIVEVPDHLLMRRQHRNASNANNPAVFKYDATSVDWMKEFFKGASWQINLPSWMLLKDHSQTIWTSRLTIGEKLKLMGVIARACSWHRFFLLGELKATSRLLFAARHR